MAVSAQLSYNREKVKGKIIPADTLSLSLIFFIMDFLFIKFIFFKHCIKMLLISFTEFSGAPLKFPSVWVTPPSSRGSVNLVPVIASWRRQRAPEQLPWKAESHCYVLTTRVYQNWQPNAFFLRDILELERLQM